jgi:UDPglucose--hexose-1-phosphate uridylyltransferase
VLFAPGRSGRPGAWLPEIEPSTEAELESCPFCAGREDRTPPQTLVLGDPWRVRVVPNLYPAFERQEVVIHTPEHIRSFAELGDDQIALIAEAWQKRRAAEPDGELLAIVNEGRLAGASLPHTHSQLIWMSERSPALAAEHPERLPELLADELLRRGGVVAAVHPIGAGPYECLIGPPEGEGALGDGLVLLRELVRRLRAVEGDRPWNAWRHEGPPWHIHFAPRLTALAAVELGAGIFINVMPPEQAADRLKRSPEEPTPR